MKPLFTKTLRAEVSVTDDAETRMVCRAESGNEAISTKVRPEVGPWIPVQTQACQGHSMLLQNVLVHEQVHFEMGAQRVLLKGLNAWMQNIEKSPSRASRKQAWLSRKFPGVHGIDPHCVQPCSMLRAQKLRGIQMPQVSMHDVPST